MSFLWLQARWINPYKLQINQMTLTSDYIEEKVRIIQLTDIHLGKYYKSKRLDKLIDKVNELKPDLIVFTGDLIDDNRTFNEVNEIVECLTKLEATYGKYAVYGNHDYAYEGDSRYRLIMQQSGFNLLVNECKLVKLDNGQKINLIGLDDCIAGNTNIEIAFKDVEDNGYNLLMVHEPDIVSELQGLPIDLLLSGHSHGGQIRFPFIGALYTPKYSKTYTKGLYKFNEQSRMQFYVSSGIGVTILPYRLMNPPEVAVFDIIENK